ncbi:hypothetical protein EXIGLDRAFT_724169 [Exidia glandulosa HHB12029]|uniref:F-box domain-containing protein n=1 Tax=Exidia glandulosa HHB12029 TaxID=1314781 RepID=A0A165EIP0_EXIGL|nr:hypothetical protein EXIGLDRAFT_724169 [Exidia glandulosa HHB12029]
MLTSINGTTNGGVIVDGERAALDLVELIRQHSHASDRAVLLETNLHDSDSCMNRLCVQTLMELGSTLPALRVFECYALLTTEADGDALLEARTEGTFLFPRVQSFLYWPNKYVPPSVTLALLAHMPNLRALEVCQEHAPNHKSSLDQRSQIDLSRLHLRSYRCMELHYGFELPILHSADTLEELYLIIDEMRDEEPLMLSPFISLLRSRCFSHIHRLTLKSQLFCEPDVVKWCSIISLCPALRNLSLRSGLDDFASLLAAPSRPLFKLELAGNSTFFGDEYGDPFIGNMLRMIQTYPMLQALQELRLHRCSADYGFLPVLHYEVSPELFDEFKMECVQRRILLKMIS